MTLGLPHPVVNSPSPLTEEEFRHRLDQIQQNFDKLDISFPVSGANIYGFYQPLDADLTSIAALATTGYGRSFLTLANSAAALLYFGGAPLASPTFTGTPAAPTASAANNTTQIATTAFVQAVIAALSLSSTYQPLDSDLTAIAALTTTTFGRSVLTQADATALRSLAGLGSLATLSTITTTEITNGTILDADINAAALIAYSKLAAMTTGQILLGNAGTPTATTMGGDATIGATGTLTIKTDVALAGNPTTTTQTAANNSTRIATTAYVDGADTTASTADRARANHTGTQLAATVSDFATAVAALITGKADLASPTFTGDPKAPTATPGDNDTSVATTAFVRAVRLDQFAAPTASVSANSQKITSLGAGTLNTTDAASMADVYAAQGGYTRLLPVNIIAGKMSQASGSLSNILPTHGRVGNVLTGSSNGVLQYSLGALTAVDVTVGLAMLIWQEGTGSGGNAAENGIYTVTQVGDATHPWILTRRTDADATGELVPGSIVRGTFGSTGLDKDYYIYSPASGSTITLNTTNMFWTDYAVNPSDGSVTNSSVSSSAAISASKLEAMATGKVIVGNAGSGTVVTLGGDASIDATGALTIGASAVTASKASTAAATTISGTNAVGSATSLARSDHNHALPALGTYFAPVPMGDTAYAVGTANRMYVAQIVVPHGATLTGVRYFVAATASGLVSSALYDSAGTTRLANKVTGQTQPGVNQLHSVAFDAAYPAAPGVYHAVLLFASTTATFYGPTINFITPTSIVATAGATPTTITPPTAPSTTAVIPSLVSY